MKGRRRYGSMCGRDREWREGGGSWQEAVLWVMGEKGEGERWLRELERERQGGEEEVGLERRGETE